MRLGEVRKVVLQQLAEVRALEDASDTNHLNAVTPYIRARLRNLGFKSSSGNTLHR